jgi:hypothetical protein
MLPTRTLLRQPHSHNRVRSHTIHATTLPVSQHGFDFSFLRLQGVYINQGDQSSARARVSALYPLNPRVQFGGTLDLTSEANSFADSPTQGLNINELYVATAPFADLPNFRLVVGQLDLTSYFDRNSFAKDAATHFFNPVFQTNPALSATGIASRPTVLVNWSITDNIEAKAAVFSSARAVNDFAVDGFAGEIGLRYGNGIIRGTLSQIEMLVHGMASGRYSGYNAPMAALVYGHRIAKKLTASMENTFFPS